MSSTTKCPKGHGYYVWPVGLSHVFDPALENCENYGEKPVTGKTHEQAFEESARKFTILSIVGLFPIFAGVYRLHQAINSLKNCYNEDENFWRIQIARGVSEVVGLGVLWFLADLIAPLAFCCIDCIEDYCDD